MSTQSPANATAQYSSPPPATPARGKRSQEQAFTGSKKQRSRSRSEARVVQESSWSSSGSLALQPLLPEGWTMVSDPAGRVYYVNHRLGESRTTSPAPMLLPEERCSWLNCVKDDYQCLRSAPPRVLDDGEIVFEAVSSALARSGSHSAQEMLNLSHTWKYNKDLQRLANCVPGGFEPPGEETTQLLLCLSKRFSWHLIASPATPWKIAQACPFSAHVTSAVMELLAEDERLSKWRAYNPDVVNFDDCGKDCQGHDCVKKVCLPAWHKYAGRPMEGLSCWRYKYWWEEKAAKVLMQIWDLKSPPTDLQQTSESPPGNDQLALGPGQIVEEAMAGNLQLPIIPFKMERHNESFPDVKERVRKFLLENLPSGDNSVPTANSAPARTAVAGANWNGSDEAVEEPGQPSTQNRMQEDVSEEAASQAFPMSDILGSSLNKHCNGKLQQVNTASSLKGVKVIGILLDGAWCDGSAPFVLETLMPFYNLVNDQPPQNSGQLTREELRRLSIRDLKDLVRKAGGDPSNCLEKEDLVDAAWCHSSACAKKVSKRFEVVFCVDRSTVGQLRALHSTVPSQEVLAHTAHVKQRFYDPLFPKGCRWLAVPFPSNSQQHQLVQSIDRRYPAATVPHLVFVTPRGQKIVDVDFEDLCSRIKVDPWGFLTRLEQASDELMRHP